MRSLPIARRLQLVKLLRAHGVKDVERLREDELKDALARLSILLPDLGADLPFAPSSSSTPSLPSSTPSSSSSTSSPSSSSSSSSTSSTESSSSFIDRGPVGAHVDLESLQDCDEQFDDPDALPRFREAKPLLPEGVRTFVRAIAVKPGELFVTWQLQGAVVGIDGATRLAVHAVDFLGAAPDPQALLESTPRFVVEVDRAAPGWYLQVPHDRLAIIVRVILGDGEGLTVAVSNVTLTPPDRAAPPGPFVLASIAPGADRRALRAARLFDAGAGTTLPAGVDVTVGGTIDESGVITSADGTIIGHGVFNGLRSSSSSSSSSSAVLSRGKDRP